MLRGYTPCRWGQLHHRETGSGPKTPLLCLHATAYSGQTFEPLMPLLAEGRRVIAVDTPGYGQSDPPPQRPSLEVYAAVMAEALPALTAAGPVDLFGFHTGAMLAADMAVQAPQAVRRLVLIGVPFFEEAEEHASWRARLVHETPLGESFDELRPRWDYFVTHRTPGLSLARAFACFVDELQARPRDSWAHASLFEHDAGATLARVQQPVLVINPTSALAAASRRAAARMPDARVVECPELNGAVFDLGAETLAQVMRPFLDGDLLSLRRCATPA